MLMHLHSSWPAREIKLITLVVLTINQRIHLVATWVGARPLQSYVFGDSLNEFHVRSIKTGAKPVKLAGAGRGEGVCRVSDFFNLKVNTPTINPPDRLRTNKMGVISAKNKVLLTQIKCLSVYRYSHSCSSIENCQTR